MSFPNFARMPRAWNWPGSSWKDHGCPPPQHRRERRAPANSESWFLRECFRFLATDGIARVVSFADPVPRIVSGRTLFVGHVGTIYQSSNAVLTGRSTPR